MIRAVIMMFIVTTISGCSLFNITPQQPPPPGREAKEITRAQSVNLPELGTWSVMVTGSPDDAGRVIAAKATAKSAAYYLIIMMQETARPGVWFARAIFYGPPRAVPLS